MEEKAVPAGNELVISDAFVVVSDDVPETDLDVAERFLAYMAALYLCIPRPEVEYHDWFGLAERGLTDLQSHKGCWTFAGGKSYLTAYTCDYETPPESMVQLAVLIPLCEYLEWMEISEHPVRRMLEESMETFYDEKLQSLVRWLPAKQDSLDGSEEHKEKHVMDSWYFHHPLMNLCRLALNGDQSAKALLMKSINYPIGVARHFEYEWPVFYRMDTLEVKKEETKPGEGGPRDTAGGYAKLMLEVWQLTGEQRYLTEAKRAVKILEQRGLDIFYQANNTAFTAVAMLRLYKITNARKYLRQSLVCIAALLRNAQLWDCNYGYSKDRSTFFGIFSLTDCTYTAAYEEQEVLSTLEGYLAEARGIELPESVMILLPELVRHGLGRIPSYYPPLRPADIFADSAKTGEVDMKLWIPVEDLYSGWEKSGKVGQEVYGAGVSFGLVSRTYHRIPGQNFLIFVDYPIAGFRRHRDAVTFRILGDPRLECRVRVILHGCKAEFALRVGPTSRKGELMPPRDKNNDYLDYLVPGGQFAKLTWQSIR